MIELFGEESLSKYSASVNTGLRYTDSEYEITYAQQRKNGIVPGQRISALLINTALRQYTAMTYLFINTIQNILRNYCGWSTGEIEANFNDITNSKINTILGDADTENSFIHYINKINDILDGTRKVNTAINYDVNSGGIKSKFDTIDSSLQQINTTTLPTAVSTLNTLSTELKNDLEDGTITANRATYANGLTGSIYSNLNSIETTMNSLGF